MLKSWLSIVETDMEELEILLQKHVSYACQFLSGNTQAWFKKNLYQLCIMNCGEFSSMVLGEFGKSVEDEEGFINDADTIEEEKAEKFSKTMQDYWEEEKEAPIDLSVIKQVKDLSTVAHRSLIEEAMCEHLGVELSYDVGIHVPCKKWALINQAQNMFDKMLELDVFHFFSRRTSGVDFLGLLMNRDGLHKLKPPILWQRLADYGGTLWQQFILLSVQVNMLEKMQDPLEEAGVWSITVWSTEYYTARMKGWTVLTLSHMATLTYVIYNLDGMSSQQLLFKNGVKQKVRPIVYAIGRRKNSLNDRGYGWIMKRETRVGLHLSPAAYFSDEVKQRSQSWCHLYQWVLAAAVMIIRFKYATRIQKDGHTLTWYVPDMALNVRPSLIWWTTFSALNHMHSGGNQEDIYVWRRIQIESMIFLRCRRIRHNFQCIDSERYGP